MWKDELKQSLITNLFSAYLTGKDNGDTRPFHDWESENRVTDLILKDIDSLLKQQREICAKKALKVMDKLEYSGIEIKNAILNAPEPTGDKKEN